MRVTWSVVAIVFVGKVATSPWFPDWALKSIRKMLQRGGKDKARKSSKGSIQQPKEPVIGFNLPPRQIVLRVARENQLR